MGHELGHLCHHMGHSLVLAPCPHSYPSLPSDFESSPCSPSAEARCTVGARKLTDQQMQDWKMTGHEIDELIALVALAYTLLSINDRLRRCIN